MTERRCATCTTLLLPDGTCRQCSADGPLDLGESSLAGEIRLPGAARDVFEPGWPRLERYEIEEPLGQGGMGEVLAARDTVLDRRVALKRIRWSAEKASEPLFERFRAEAKLTAALDHPHIVPIHDLFEADGRLYYAMKEVRGVELGRVVADARQPLPALLRGFVKICDAVAFAHARGVLHRDLKPENVMVGEHGQVFVMDWGLARAVESPAGGDEDLARRTSAHGTPAYAAPEQRAGDPVDERTDVYLLGGILYFILTATPPHRSREGGPVESATRRAPERPIPRELEAIAGRALDPDPASRYPDVASLSADIESYLDGRLVGAARYNPLERAWKWGRRHPTISVGLLVLALGVGATYAGLAWSAARDLAAAEERTILEAGELRAAATARLDRLEPVQPEGSAALWQPNGEPDVDAVEGWFDAHARALEALDSLAALDREAPTEAARRVIDRPAVDARRSEVALAAARQAAELADYALARMWVDRASAAGLGSIERDGFLSDVDRLREERREERVQAARDILARAREPGASERLESLLVEIVRLGSPEVVSLLLSPDHLDSPFEWEQRLAIRALGSIGDGRTIGPEGKDAVVALVVRLASVDLVRRVVHAIDLARALGSLGDQRADAVLARRRAEAGMSSLFWRATETAYAQIPLPENLVPGTPAEYHDRGRRRAAKGDLAGAIDDYTRAVDGAVPTAAVLVDRGMARYGTGDPQGAIEDYDRALEIDPDSPVALNDRGNAWLALGEWTRAIADFSRVLEAEPGLAATWQNRALARALSGDQAGARADYDRALTLDRRLIDAWTGRGFVRFEMGDVAEAIADHSRAIELDPDFPDAYSNRGVARAELGELDGAIADYTRAIDLKPHAATTWSNRGFARQRKGDLDGAIADHSRALEIAPDLVDAYLNRARAYLERGQLQSARSDTQAAIAIAPSSADAHHVQGRVLQALGDVDGALAAYSRAIEVDPECARALYDRGRLRSGRGDVEGAIEDYSAAAGAEPSFADAFYNRGNLRSRSGDVGGAIADWTLAIDADPSHDRAFNNRGLARMARGDLAGAIDDFTQAIEIAPEQAGYWNHRAGARLRAIRIPEALEDWEQALQIEPDNWQALANYGRTLSLPFVNRREEAAVALSRALELAPAEARGQIEELLKRVR